MTIDFKALNEKLAANSYLEGDFATTLDSKTFDQIETGPFDCLNVLRWYLHIAALKKRDFKFPESTSATNRKAEAEEDEDVDLFASDDEVDEAAERLKAERLAEYQKKKALKPKTIAKSFVGIYVKPWDDTTDMQELKDLVLSIKMDGLEWKNQDLEAVSFGISKWLFHCVVEDDKVSIDDLQEMIEGFEDHCQSTDVAYMNKV